MKVSFDSKGGFDNALNFLKGATNRNANTILNSIANEGVKNLKMNTPKDTGKTANGWTSEINVSKGRTEIVWKNNAHPELEVNLAKLIELGHGTKNGGYVSPRPYIKRSMDSVFRTAGDKLAGELFK